MPPLMLPLRTFSQWAYSPAAQGAHGGEMPRTSHDSAGSMTTRVPVFHCAGTDAPASTISPTSSWPSTNGVETNGEKYGLPRQAMAQRSDPQTPLSRVLMRTHSGVGSGGGSTSVNSMHD